MESPTVGHGPTNTELTPEALLAPTSSLKTKKVTAMSPEKGSGIFPRRREHYRPGPIRGVPTLEKTTILLDAAQEFFLKPPVQKTVREIRAFTSGLLSPR